MLCVSSVQAAYNGKGNACSKNAAIALARLAKDEQMSGVLKQSCMGYRDHLSVREALSSAVLDELQICRECPFCSAGEVICDVTSIKALVQCDGDPRRKATTASDQNGLIRVYNGNAIRFSFDNGHQGTE